MGAAVVQKHRASINLILRHRASINLITALRWSGAYMLSHGRGARRPREPGPPAREAVAAAPAAGWGTAARRRRTLRRGASGTWPAGAPAAHTAPAGPQRRTPRRRTPAGGPPGIAAAAPPHIAAAQAAGTVGWVPPHTAAAAPVPVTTASQLRAGSFRYTSLRYLATSDTQSLPLLQP